jgi:hypothetical protein
MRSLARTELVRRFMCALGERAAENARVYFTGGVTALLLGWREATIDIDLHVVPDRDDLLRAIAGLKDELQVNVELVSPAHFIPELPGWETRSAFIAREGRVSFHHYDLYSQALAKVERGHDQDHADVARMLASGLVEGPRLQELFETIVDRLYRYPAVDERAFRRRLQEALTR